MTAAIYVTCAGALMGLALYGLLAAREVLRRLLAVNVLGAAVFLLVVGLGEGGDPLAQALVITGVVVAVSTTAVGLALIRSLRRR